MKMDRFVLMAAAIWSFSTTAALAQTPVRGEPEPVFEVASIKPSTEGGKPSLRALPGGRTVASNATLKLLIELAYNVREYQITGGPKWIDSTGYDIEAKPAVAFRPSYDTRAYAMRMMQALLEGRFKLGIRRESRELPVYVLVVGKDGSKLKERKEPENPLDMRMSGGKGLMIAQGIPMPILIESLSSLLGRAVHDETDLKGYYDFRLAWTPDDADTAGPSIFTAVQEQLGLKLEARKGQVEMLVIESATQPSGN